MDEGMTVTLEQAIIDDLTAELQIADKNFNPDLLRSKVQNVLREVKRARKYPASYSDNQIMRDMENYYSNIRNLALYDYNTIGMEFQTSSSENSTSRSMEDRNKLFAGIVPLSRF